jgi:hypothetical protein
VLAVFISRGGDDQGGGGPLNAIAEAAVKTQDEGGGRAVMRGVISAPGRSQPLVLTGHLVYNAADLSRGTINVAGLKPEEAMELEMVQEGTTIYMRSERFGSLPDGREWMGLDLALGDEIDASVPTNGDARGELELLEKAFGGVKKVGREIVRGVPTTHYRGKISPAENVERLRAEGADTAASYVEEQGTPLGVEAWIDSDNLVRRMRIRQTMQGEDGEGPTTIDMRTDFVDFGIEPEIDVPDSSEVFDATSVAEEQLDAAGK